MEATTIRESFSPDARNHAVTALERALLPVDSVEQNR